jgi:hypothetical protein
MYLTLTLLYYTMDAEGESRVLFPLANKCLPIVGLFMPQIISLRETSANQWQARYQGNYGVYTIKITTDGKKTKKFSCTCPSDYYPCKHISMIEEAIAERIAKNKKAGIHEGLGPELLLKDLSREELYDFIVNQLNYIPELYDKVMLEFSYKAKSGEKNKYSPVLRKALAALEFYYDDYDSEEWRTIDIFDEWLEKAQGYLKQNNGAEAALIAMACIEEYALWFRDIQVEFQESMDESYETEPFAILEAAVQKGFDEKEIFDYCMLEMQRDKYAGTYFFDGFNRLLMKVSARVDPDAFIALQEALLKKAGSTDSYGAEKILQREIDFYRIIHKPDKAWKLIADNIQILNFRKALVEKKISAKQYGEAKKLIQDHLGSHDDSSHDDSSHLDGNNYRRNIWDEYLLDIAQKEDDISVIQAISFSYIKDHFTEEKYLIYKSTFTAAQWSAELEKLIVRYEKNRGYSNESLFSLLAAEKDVEKLLHYIEKHLTLQALVKYHKVFASPYPEKTLALFRTVLDKYAEEHIGRSYYEEIIQCLRKMEKIKGGGRIIKEMIASYKTRYKIRRAFMELLNKF